IVTVNESVKRRKKGGRVRKCLGPSALVVADDDTKRVNVNVNHQVSLAIRQLLFIVGVSLGAVNSVYFQPMIDAISAQGHAECTGSIIQALHALKNLHPDGRRSGGSGRLSSLAAVKGAEVVGCVQDRTDVSIRVE
ncbi:hypothetical protein Tco_0115160, partial [Tanacetum coccineum]